MMHKNRSLSLSILQRVNAFLEALSLMVIKHRSSDIRAWKDDMILIFEGIESKLSTKSNKEIGSVIG